MRFPRTNLTDAGDFSSEIETDLPAENPGEKLAAPIWQSNFSLAPNVRFTRTPETLISRRRAPNEPVRDDSQIGQQAIRIEPVAVDVPFDIYLPEPDEISVAPHRVELQQSPLPDEPGALAFRASAELSSISDFAFWEVMAFEEAEPVRAPPLISFPKTETSPESITSLFRIMEWRPGRSAPAPVTSRPVPQPAAISAKVAVRPPAAPSLERPRRIAVEAPVAPVPQAAPTSQVAPAPQIASAPQAAPAPQRTPPVAAVLPSPRLAARPERIDASGYEFPPRALLQEPPERLGEIMSQETLEQNAGLLESVLEDFGIKGEIIHVRPGPVVTLYEFELRRRA